MLRFWPEYVELRRWVEAGEFGRPVAVSTHRLSPPADWNRWMTDPAQSGGVPVDLLVHDFDPRLALALSLAAARSLESGRPEDIGA